MFLFELLDNPVEAIKIIFINYGTDDETFDFYVSDFVEDLGSISDKYEYRKIVGRPRDWRRFVVHRYNCSNDNFSIERVGGIKFLRKIRKAQLINEYLKDSIYFFYI